MLTFFFGEKVVGTITRAEDSAGAMTLEATGIGTPILAHGVEAFDARGERAALGETSDVDSQEAFLEMVERAFNGAADGEPYFHVRR